MLTAVLSHRVKVTLIALCVVAWMPCVAAQGAPPQQPAPQQLQQQLDMMGPMMGKMMEGMYAAILRTLARPETADQLATFMKNYRDALVAKGFTKEEALEIVKNAGIPGMPAAR